MPVLRQTLTLEEVPSTPRRQAIMRQRSATRRSMLGIAALATLAFGVAACTQGPAAPGSTASAKTGLETLNDALAKTKGQSYKFAIAYGTLTNGSGWSSGDGATTTLAMKI